jgi:hypothetical protein
VLDSDAEEWEQPLIKSICMHGAKRITLHMLDVNTDVKSTAVAAMPPAQAIQKVSILLLFNLVV